MRRGQKKLSEEQIREKASEVEHLFKDAVHHYEYRRRLVELENANAYRGYQIGLDNVDVVPEDEYADPHNIIGPIVSASVSATLDRIPNITVPSAKDDEKSRRRAHATELLARSFWHSGIIDYDEFHRCISWAKQGGLGWMRHMWNADLGRELPEQHMLEAQPDADGQWHEAEEQQFDIDYDDLGERILPVRTEGEIENTFVSSTDLFVDPAARTEREIRYVCHSILRPIDELQDLWPKDFFGKPASFDQGAEFSQEQYRRSQQDDPWLSGPGMHKKNALAQIVFHWENRCRRYPNGRLVIFSGPTLFYYGPNPLEPCRIPFTPFYGDIMVPGSLYADSIIRRLIGLQSSVNHAANKQREMLDRNVNGHWLIPKGSARKEDFTNKTARTIEYNRGLGKPEQSPIPDLPQSVSIFIDQVIDRANKISGYNDVSRGDQAIQGDLSGRAIRMLKNNEQALRRPSMISFQIQFAKMVQQNIHLARQFYDEGRILRRIGENNEWLTAQFRADDYEFDTDVIPEVFSGAPQTSDELLSETIELAEAQLLSDTPEAERARVMIQDRYVGRTTFDKSAADRSKARRHIAAIQDNPFVVVQAAEFDDHRVAIDTINEFRKTLEYENLSQLQRAKIDQLAEEHEAYDEMQQMAFAQQQALLGQGGAGPTPPGGPPPPGASQPVNPGVESPQDGGHSPEGSLDDEAA